MVQAGNFSVSMMLVHAFKHHRAGISHGPMLLREAFVESCIRYACLQKGQGQLFLDGLMPVGESRKFVKLDLQAVDSQQPSSRPDLTIRYRTGWSVDQQRMRVELKIDASLTTAQLQAGYAHRFLCPSKRESGLREALHGTGAEVVSWASLLTSIRGLPLASEQDLALWELICSLGEDFGQDVSLLPAAAVLFDLNVAGAYSTALHLMGRVIDVLQHQPLLPPKPHVGRNYEGIGVGGIDTTSLIFTPESYSSPISVRYKGDDHYYALREVGARHFYEHSDGSTVTLPLEDGVAPNESVYFEESLTALKWDSSASEAGAYLHKFLAIIRSIAKVNPEVTLEQVRLGNQNVGYVLRNETVAFYALFDARCWVRSPELGPFVIYKNAESPVEDAVHILRGDEATGKDVETRIHQFLMDELRLAG